MKRPHTSRRNATFARVAICLASFSLVYTPVCACTIFMLTDGRKALFFNNEDWSNPETRIWFVPDGPGYYGCAYLGFDDGWAQGGLNTEGLAFDWVAGGRERWPPELSNAPRVRGNPSQRMLETCASVEEAVAFYRRYREPAFCCATIMVADRTGASAIIGARDGQLYVERSRESRGFGYGGRTLADGLAKSPGPEIDRGAEILEACSQTGEYATKYSNVFDLRSGDIFLLQGRGKRVRLNLTLELRKGAHYYEIPKVSQQLLRPPVRPPNSMKRFFLDEYQPIPDDEPAVTARLRAAVLDAVAGSMHPEDYTSVFWKEISSQQKGIQASLRRLGRFVSMTPVGGRGRAGAGSGERLYKIEFERATVLQSYSLDAQARVSSIRTEGIELTSEMAVRPD